MRRLLEGKNDGCAILGLDDWPRNDERAWSFVSQSASLCAPCIFCGPGLELLINYFFNELQIAGWGIVGLLRFQGFKLDAGDVCISIEGKVARRLLI